jgi:hypothetical protein
MGTWRLCVFLILYEVVSKILRTGATIYTAMFNYREKWDKIFFHSSPYVLKAFPYDKYLACYVRDVGRKARKTRVTAYQL